MLHKLPGLLAAAAVLFVLLAGVSKSIDLPAFGRALETWSIFPGWAIGVLTLTVPAIEITLSLLWLCKVNRRATGVLLALMLGLFAAVYAVQLLSGGAPDCGCTSQILFLKHLRTEGAWLIARNSALAVAIVAGTYHPPAVLAKAPRSDSSATRAAPRGFTLIESLVVISIVAIVIALSMPVLAKVRTQSRLTKSLTNLRTHAQVITLYTNDWKDTYPHFISAASGRGGFDSPCLPGRTSTYYFSQSSRWHLVLGPVYYGGCSTSVFTTPETATEGFSVGDHSEYQIPCVFQAAPEYWSDSTHVGPSQWRAVGAHEVLFPDRRSLVWAARPWDFTEVGAGDVARLAFVDGSAAAVPSLHGGIDAYPYDGPYEGAVHSGLTAPAMHTRLGVRGRDR
ncbi:MAG: prepilin-type N-terminal cleavage/methylation domain-containing protein [Tepidisphaera sp.]